VAVVPVVIDCKFRLDDRGFIVGDNDDECLVIEFVPTQPTGVKTDRLPYTKDVMKTLIVMVEFGAALDLAHDDRDMAAFLVALEEVHAVRPLGSYRVQKMYFESGQQQQHV
jgi:hypothetical protein